jgi:hypothetical protein
VSAHIALLADSLEEINPALGDEDDEKSALTQRYLPGA